MIQESLKHTERKQNMHTHYRCTKDRIFINFKRNLNAKLKKHTKLLHVTFSKESEEKLLHYINILEDLTSPHKFVYAFNHILIYQ